MNDRPILTAFPSATSISSISTTSVISLSAEDPLPFWTHHIVEPETERAESPQDGFAWYGWTKIVLLVCLSVKMSMSHNFRLPRTKRLKKGMSHLTSAYCWSNNPNRQTDKQTNKDNHVLSQELTDNGEKQRQITFRMRLCISIKGLVCPSVRLSVGLSVMRFFQSAVYVRKSKWSERSRKLIKKSSGFPQNGQTSFVVFHIPYSDWFCCFLYSLVISTRKL